MVQDEYKEMTVAQLIFRAGGPRRFNFPKPRRVARALTELPSALHIYKFSFFVVVFFSDTSYWGRATTPHDSCLAIFTDESIFEIHRQVKTSDIMSGDLVTPL